MRLASVLARHRLGYLVEVARLGWIAPFHRGLLGHPRRERPYTAAEHARMALEDLGPAFVKLGQLLSARADVLPPAYQAELARLQDAAPPEPPGTVEAVIEGELGRPVRVVFARFDPEPLAAASIGQAHAARLPDGTEVVVKVRRPAAVAQVEVDLALLVKTAAMTEGLAALLDPDFVLVAAFAPYAARLAVAGGAEDVAVSPDQSDSVDPVGAGLPPAARVRPSWRTAPILASAAAGSLVALAWWRHRATRHRPGCAGPGTATITRAQNVRRNRGVTGSPRRWWWR